jgi:ribulose-5-phosphate 4-epimerase/fuculose-1-phosphate aldolase
MQLVRERERIVAAARRLAGDGQVAGTAGNLSERAGELVAVTPRVARSTV